jgi:signal transduction histidine kinase
MQSFLAAVRTLVGYQARMLACTGSVRVRLTIAVVVLSSAGLAAGGALLVRGVETTVIRAIEEQSLAELKVVRAQVEGGVPIESIRVSGRDRTVRFVRSDGSKLENHWPAGFGSAVTPPKQPDRVFNDRRLPPSSVVKLPMVSPAQGPLDAIAVSSLDDVRRSTRTLQQILQVGIPMLVILLTLATWILVGRALRPVHIMTRHAARISDARGLDRLSVPPTFDEVAELAHTLNGMLDRIAKGALRQREFVSDASHELRSPITAIRALLEVALAHPGRMEPATVLRGVLAETTRLEALVADLLALARLDEGHVLHREEIDLDDVIFEDASRARAVSVETQHVTGIKVWGERKSLSHLVRNLLDNAARHAASQVVVAARREGNTSVLLVDDDGPGIPENDRARVFERFIRLAPSRSRDTGGAGLGLAVVQRIAEQHGATVLIDRSPQGGARLEVRFPSRSVE